MLKQSWSEMSSQPWRFAVIPTNGRPCYKLCLEAIDKQVNSIVMVEGGPDAQMLSVEGHYSVIREPELNISKWWNLGLALCESKAKQMKVPKWDVAILNDDVIVPSGWMQAVSEGMRAVGAAAGCSGAHGPHTVLHQQPGPVGLATRMVGYAFVLAGEKGVRANEQLRWYFSDDHVDWMARRAGGMAMVPGHTVQHLHPNAQMSGELHATVPEDAARFAAYWGMRPW